MGIGAPIQVRSLSVVAVYVSDLTRARAFYEGLLGFDFAEEMDPGVLLRAGDVMLYVEPGRVPRGRGPGREAETAPCFAIQDGVKSAYAALSGAGVTIVQEYVEYSPTFAFFCAADPDGNRIEFAGTP
jgi:catechol 2,3-dioxygenase-like lactoylglutathione lyase family enzyme